MRLLNVHTLELADFSELDDLPTYMILSHRWSDEEVSYKDWCKNRNTERSGYRKIVDFCQMVRENSNLRWGRSLDVSEADLQYVSPHWVWIDTCEYTLSDPIEMMNSLNIV